MRRKMSWILASVAALVGVALIVSSIVQNGRVTIIHRKAAANTYDFVVADHGSLIVARQGVGTGPGYEGDAGEFGKFSFSAHGTIPLTIAAGQITVQGSRITVTADPISGNIQHGFLWMNLNGGALSTPTVRVQLTCQAAGAPMWILGVPLLAPFMVMLVRNRRSVRRRRAGLCIQCGYDLRASPERCPECGSVSIASARVA
jgi:hypothetical protein